jgi:hypothetical protein
LWADKAAPPLQQRTVLGTLELGQIPRGSRQTSGSFLTTDSRAKDDAGAAVALAEAGSVQRFNPWSRWNPVVNVALL